MTHSTAGPKPRKTSATTLQPTQKALSLPRLMVAMNGARKNKHDHPALPLTKAEILTEAKLCFHAGADGLHLHVRDEQGLHSLSAEIYKDTLDELAIELPLLKVQITTEAVDLYQPFEQRALVETLKPALVSISIAEMSADKDVDAVDAFYQQCVANNIAVQHILYSDDDVSQLMQLAKRAGLPMQGLQMLFVLGRYTQGQQSDPKMLQTFLQRLNEFNVDASDADWAVCAFGQQETACLEAAWKLGGKLRVGFENSLVNHNGAIASNNAERVSEIVTRCLELEPQNL